ncbi:MFS transporter, partial [Staphylococcus aureus]
VFPVEKRGFAMGLTGIVAQSAPAIGPTLTGVLIDFSSWHLPFIVVAVISLIAFVVGIFYVENLGQSKPTVLDKRSVVYS